MKRQWLYFALIFIAILPILLLRDFTADNELKYLSIADEAIENSNIFAFYNHGEPYADKPPLYLWFVMLGKIIFGKHVMFYLSLLSVIPAFVTAWIMGKFTGRVLTERESGSTLLMLFTTAFFLAPIIVLRMDMLMTMFITLALYTFYRMYEYNTTEPEYGARLQRKRQWLLPLYIFLALFSKGPVGLMLPLAAIVVFLAVSRRLGTIGKYLGYRCWLLLLAIWAIAAAGILVAALWINCPKAFSSVIYILMGWLCLGQIRRILTALPEGAFAWLLAGGLLYTAGGVLYALKLPVFRRLPKNFGAHEIFHLFVMAGSLCHYVMMYAYVC